MNLLEPFLVFVPYLALIIRVWMGSNMIIHGYPKLKAPRQTAESMQKMGVPRGATYTVTVLEFFGGIFLIIGLIVPIVGIFFGIEMIANSILKKTKMKASYIAPGKSDYELDIV